MFSLKYMFWSQGFDNDILQVIADFFLRTIDWEMKLLLSYIYFITSTLRCSQSWLHLTHEDSDIIFLGHFSLFPLFCLVFVTKPTIFCSVVIGLIFDHPTQQPITGGGSRGVGGGVSYSLSQW